MGSLSEFIFVMNCVSNVSAGCWWFLRTKLECDSAGFGEFRIRNCKLSVSNVGSEVLLFVIVCLFVCLFVCLKCRFEVFVCLLFVCLFVCLFVYSDSYQTFQN